MLRSLLLQGSRLSGEQLCELLSNLCADINALHVLFAWLLQGSRLSGEQLCELLPLVQEADLAVPVDWLEAALDKIQVGQLRTAAKNILDLRNRSCSQLH
jgi:hypothetical protein